jgi:hypothetical protein
MMTQPPVAYLEGLITLPIVPLMLGSSSFSFPFPLLPLTGWGRRRLGRLLTTSPAALSFTPISLWSFLLLSFHFSSNLFFLLTFTVCVGVVTFTSSITVRALR